jgi:hypothetical protein
MGCRIGVARAVLAGAVLTAPLSMAAPSTDVPIDAAVKATLLFNFAKFTEWPSLSDGANMNGCVVGDEQIATVLEQVVRGHPIDGHTFIVTTPGDSTQWSACQLLFVSDAQTRTSGVALKALRRLPVLTVSDAKDFAQNGGSIEFYVDGTHMRFAINVDAATRTGLRLSSRLLELAKIVRDGSVK